MKPEETTYCNTVKRQVPKILAKSNPYSHRANGEPCYCDKVRRPR
jgi:hypothetical protein